MSHLLNVTVANTGYVFNLDAQVEKSKDMQIGKKFEKNLAVQTDLHESIGQFYKLDTFIDTGMSLTCVVNNANRIKIDQALDFPLIQKIIANQ